MDASILIPPHWDIEFHVHIDIFNLAIKVLLAQILAKKHDQLIAYTSWLFNNTEWNYTMTKRETLAMVHALHKFRHHLLGNKFIFCVDHMVFLYLLRKAQVSRKIGTWLFLFFEYDFSIIYKPGRFHYVVDVLSWMFDFTKENGILDQTTIVMFFLLQPVWL